MESLTQENISVTQAGMVGAIYCAAAPQPCHQLSCRDVGADYRAGLGFL